MKAINVTKYFATFVLLCATVAHASSDVFVLTTERTPADVADVVLEKLESKGFQAIFEQTQNRDRTWSYRVQIEPPMTSERAAKELARIRARTGVVMRAEQLDGLSDDAKQMALDGRGVLGSNPYLPRFSSEPDSRTVSQLDRRQRLSMVTIDYRMGYGTRQWIDLVCVYAPRKGQGPQDSTDLRFWYHEQAVDVTTDSNWIATGLKKRPRGDLALVRCPSYVGGAVDLIAATSSKVPATQSRTRDWDPAFTARQDMDPVQRELYDRKEEQRQKRLEYQMCVGVSSPYSTESLARCGPRPLRLQ